MDCKIIFFGSSEFSIYTLEELSNHNIKPILIVTTEDKPKGRKLLLTPNPVKIWGQNNNIEVITPKTLRDLELPSKLQSKKADLFLVSSYGKIIPKEVFSLPEKKTINIHPSMLPKYRGASPIQNQILNNEKEIGVTIMQIVEEMDAGPIIVQKQVNLSPLLGRLEIEKRLAIEGTRLFCHILSEWISGVINPIKQNEKEASYCQKIKKEDGLINLNENPDVNILKIKAFEEWPGSYFYTNNKRIIIKKASLENGLLKITKVLPEGKKEMSYEDFLRG